MATPYEIANAVTGRILMIIYESVAIGQLNTELRIETRNFTNYIIFKIPQLLTIHY